MLPRQLALTVGVIFAVFVIALSQAGLTGWQVIAIASGVWLLMPSIPE